MLPRNKDGATDKDKRNRKRYCYKISPIRRSIARPGRYRARPSALTKLFAFVQIAARDPPGPADRESRRRRPPHSTTNNNLLFQRAPGAGLSFWPGLQGTANPDGPGTTGLGGCSSPIPGVVRPPSIILTPSSVPRLLAYHGPRFPSPGAEGLAQNSHHVRIIQQVLTKALSEIGYEAPQDVVKLIARVTSSRAAPRAAQHHQ
ncbi:hypothetical protein EVAR_88740_1 [Eumeta japonica]|uniref:Uncharacterized protein n=1 Tax=Eumeta variegata TaxID=151549 RepID=A0A4C1XR39_EUMVA|nr:hypothetical protein EVAR_88740_1 [Eumeta japonica]